MRCLTTNPQPQNDRLAAALRAEGLDVVQLPLHEVTAMSPAASVQSMLDNADWIIVVSQYCLSAMQSLSMGNASRVAAVGAATAAALQRIGVAVSLVGDGGGEVLARLLIPQLQPETRVVIFQAEDGRTEWHALLRDAGAVVTIVPTHRLVPRTIDSTAFHHIPIDAVLFTAPSAVHRFAQLFPGLRSRCFAIGATTAAALRDAGLLCDGIPPAPEFSAFAKYVALRLRDATSPR